MEVGHTIAFRHLNGRPLARHFFRRPPAAATISPCHRAHAPGTLRMAWRIDTAVVKGELDNSERGRVHGRLWLLGRDQPLVLDLEGDPWRDLAGMKLTFSNPDPQPQEAAAQLQADQRGSVGDITASRKVKFFNVPDEEWQEALREDRLQDIPIQWKNSLYLEWFSFTQGRCVIESADFELAIVSGPEWEMDEDEEAAQRLANLQAMRSFLETIIQRPPPREDGGEDTLEDVFSEEAWEEQLKASDRMLAADLEALEKYGEDEDADEKTAFVMGWDNLLDFSAGAKEQTLLPDLDAEEEPQVDDLLETGADSEDEAGWLARATSNHPLKQSSRELVVRVMRETRASGLNDDGSTHGDPLDRFIANVMQISGKLAGALGPPPGDPRIQRGYTLAITRRCLNWANEALTAVDELLNEEKFAIHRPLFESWRADVFKLREGISDLRHELRSS
jgi:hypothetical protein